MSDNTNPSGSEALSVNEAADMLLNSLPEEGQQEDIQEAQDEDTEEVESSTDEGEESESDESEGEEGEEQVEEQPISGEITVKVDGEEIKVTLDELKSGYSRTQDYTRKTQEVAQARKALEQELTQVNAERQQYAQLLGTLTQQLQGAEAEPDWDTLRQTDPIEYSLQMADWQRKQQKISLARQEQARVMQQIQQDNMKQMQERLKKESEALSALIPEWKDAEKAKVIKQLVKDQGKKLGFSDDELSNVTDHRAILALRKAALYDQLMSKRETVKTVATQKTLKAGTKSNPGNVDLKRAQAAFQADKSTRNAARLLENLL